MTIGLTSLTDQNTETDYFTIGYDDKAEISNALKDAMDRLAKKMTAIGLTKITAQITLIAHEGKIERGANIEISRTEKNSFFVKGK